MLKRAWITLLCSVAIYVLTFVVITRWSLHVERLTGASFFDYNVYFFAPPFNCCEIASSPCLESIHYFLASVFHPLVFFDYHLTGCCLGNLPLMKLTGESEATSE